MDFERNSYSVAEGGSVEVCLTLNRPAGRPITVQVGNTPGSAGTGELLSASYAVQQPSLLSYRRLQLTKLHQVTHVSSWLYSSLFHWLFHGGQY